MRISLATDQIFSLALWIKLPIEPVVSSTKHISMGRSAAFGSSYPAGCALAPGGTSGCAWSSAHNAPAANTANANAKALAILMTSPSQKGL